MICIKHATIFTPVNEIDNGTIIVEGDRIVRIDNDDSNRSNSPDTITIDAEGLYLVPGFIDLQLNGGFGFDFTYEPQSIWSVAQKLPRFGVTSFLPTIVTSPLEKIEEAQSVLKKQPGGFLGAAPLGLHLEGPFLSAEKNGAHNQNYLCKPSLELIADWDIDHSVRIVTLAPELPGALGVITALSEKGVVVGIGHTMATYSEAMLGIDAGANLGTHLFNAMPPLNHRNPGAVGALLADERVVASLIADRVHVDAVIVKLIWQILGPDRLCLITDAMGALGRPPGKYRVHDFDVVVDGVSARLRDGILAGSILSMDKALRNLIEISGCNLNQALPTITSTPANLLGISESRGTIKPGVIADLVLLNNQSEVKLTIASGEIVFDNLEKNLQ